MLIISSLPLMAQKNNIDDRYRWSFSFGLGCLSYIDSKPMFSITLDGTIYGFHIDFSDAPRIMGNTTGVDDYDDREGWAIHGGYTIEVRHRTIFITPLAGYARMSRGETIGSDWTYDYDTGIDNDYAEFEHWGGFDYGLKVGWSPVENFSFDFIATRYALSCGFGLMF